MKYYSDKKIGKTLPSKEEISISLWNGIVSIFDEYKINNYFSFSFPNFCSDNKNLIIGLNDNSFNDRLKAEIPNIEIPIKRIIEEVSFTNDTKKIDTFSTLDFIQFLCKHLKLPVRNDYHDFFKHFHYTFEDDESTSIEFKEKINQLFKRNGVIYTLNENFEFERLIKPEFIDIIERKYNTSDPKLNELLSFSFSKFKFPRIEDRQIALEKIWDAFERVKTFFHSKTKKQSIEKILELVSNGDNDLYNMLNNEAKFLTQVGNKYQIRHFEKKTKEISKNLIDYFFYRMISFIDLVIPVLYKNIKI